MVEVPGFARPQAVTCAADFHLGTWLVQPGLNRLSRDGTAVHLRPQLMDVLVCLAQHPGDTVARTQMLDQVWPNQFVADTALARCVAELRQALGDRAQNSDIIETIPKRGYRLIAPVTPVNGNGHAGVAAAAVALKAPVPTAQVETLQLRTDLVLPGAGFGPTDAGAPQAGTTAAVVPVIRRRAPGLAAIAGFVLVAAAVAATLWIWRSTPAAPAIGERDALLLSFTNNTGDAAFDGALETALAIHLEQSPFLRLVAHKRMSEALQYMRHPPDAVVTPDLALQLCERLGAKAVLSGTIASLGRQYVIGLEATACATRETIARVQTTTPLKQQVLVSLSQAADTMRERLGESMASIRRFDVPLASATTPSLDALRALSAGDREQDRGRFPQALEAYQRAASLDPGFALAHARLGAMLLSLQRRSEAELPLRRAYEVRDRTTLNERLYITGHYFAGVMQDPLQAVDAFAAWSQSYPGSVEAHVSLAAVYQQIGLWMPAIDEATLALQLDPDNARASFVLAGALSGAGRHDEALTVLTDVNRRGLTCPGGHDLRFSVAYATRNAAAMAEEDTFARGDASMVPFLLVRRAKLAMAEGRFRDASRLWADVRAAADTREDRDTVSISWLAEAASRALLGERSAVVHVVGQALAGIRSPSRLAQAALVLGLAGRADDAKRYLAEYDRIAGLTSGRDPEFVRPAQAAIAVVEGRFADVPGLLEPLTPYEMGPRFECLPPFIRAHAYLGLGRADDARREFQAIIDNRGTAPLSFIRPLAYLGRARANAALLRTADSRRDYQEFLRLWSGGDQDLPLLATARAELKQLR